MSKETQSVFTWKIELQITLYSLKLLFKELGAIKLCHLSFHMFALQLQGEPFRTFPKATEEGDIFSRKQIGPAIVLYKALRKLYSEERALQISESIIIDSTLIFLRQAIGAINRTRVEAMNEPERQSWLSQIAAQFLNATIRWNRIGLSDLSFTITHCYFPKMCADAGVAELAPIFCKGDAVYFGEEQEGVSLNRPHTIALGSQDCLFEMKLVQIKPKSSNV
jgi:hypothetical protein